MFDRIKTHVHTRRGNTPPLFLTHRSPAPLSSSSTLLNLEREGSHFLHFLPICAQTFLYLFGLPLLPRPSRLTQLSCEALSVRALAALQQPGSAGLQCSILTRLTAAALHYNGVPPLRLFLCDRLLFYLRNVWLKVKYKVSSLSPRALQCRGSKS